MVTDEEIYLRYRANDDDADLETLLIRHRDGLLLFLLGFVRNTEDAEELLIVVVRFLPKINQATVQAPHPAIIYHITHICTRRTA